MLTVDIEPVFQAERDFERAVRKVSDGARRGVDMATREGALEALRTRRYEDQTGLLSSRIKGWVEVSTEGGAFGWIGAFTDYASFVDAGTRPHEIRGNPLLTFKTRDGQWVSTPLVNHPGTKPDGFMGRAFHKAERVLIREIEVGVAEMQRILDG